ncbi:vesicle-fusing ATPase [Thecamonas trahens ATCC 50062]|uniref:Vesicle-fusing ATPase n=1 Tax=Thecamonas trahens ATCC 50062 TaxID=461836 RepID=A0A0L0D947_THETB|nr:vesicle-fusing ATPase [Thecamonas trahens ATCC 50062]KNC48869.1 vesicle-fusing ATPase [Thecamonas trahens ATCC 50062]|eukprot:XP_013758289.1 vesicle-fusing ATPase [Thecamonas trahens ATCC 50062]
MSASAPLLSLSVAKCPSSDAALTNMVYLSPADAAVVDAAAGKSHLAGAPSRNIRLISQHAGRGPFVFVYAADPKIADGTVGLSGMQRKTAQVSMRELLAVEVYAPKVAGSVTLGMIELEVSFRKKTDATDEELNTDVMSAGFLRDFVGQVFTVGQDVLLDYRGIMLVLRVADLRRDGAADAAGRPPRDGLVVDATQIVFTSSNDSAARVKLSGDAAAGPSLFKSDWNFEDLGIGGLDDEFSSIFRRAFSSRTFSPSLIKKLNIRHVKGVLLYGPPGTGKTLMARQIGKMLNAVEPKIVNGPEIFSKYVGDSERNIRELFADAEADQAQYGDSSPLHIIIFDEMDAVVRQRGSRSGDTGAGDQVVNQLLSKIDGVDELDNVLIIGMTNRKDMLDEAILRPGRLEVHIEVSLADYEGRIQIFNIHTKSMRENGLLGTDVSIEELAAATKNYTGAEIAGVVKSASSFALSRHVDVAGMGAGAAAGGDPADTLRVTRDDFLRALEEVRPALGSSDEDYNLIMRAGMIEYGPAFAGLMDAASLLVQQIKRSARTSLVTAVIAGAPGCGKSSIAVKLAADSDIPFVRVISADKFVSLSELSKCDRIVQTFLDAYKSPVSVLIIDDIERILGYSALGARYSNPVLQTLMAYLNKPPPEGHSLIVFATSSSLQALEALGLLSIFDGVLSVPSLTTGAEVTAVLDGLDAFEPAARARVAANFSGSVPIKKLIMMVEMAREAVNPADKFEELLLSNQLDGMVKLN